MSGGPICNALSVGKSADDSLGRITLRFLCLQGVISIQRGKWWAGRDSNPGPTPKTFGAARPSGFGLAGQMENGERGVLLALEASFQVACLTQGGHFLRRHQFEVVAQALRGVCLTTAVLSQAAFQVCSR